MRRLERGNDALRPRQQCEGIQRFAVGARGVPDPPRPCQLGMLGTHARIVEAGGHRVRFADLAVLVLEHERSRAVQHADGPADDRSRVTAAGDALTSRLDADQTDTLVGEERAEDTDGVRAPADARHDRVRQTPEGRDALIAGLGADDRLKVADHRGIRMGTDRGAKQVIRGADVRHPVADRFVHRVLQRAAPGLDLADLGAQQLHAEDVRLLASCVDGAHVHDALEPEESARGRGGDAVLARPGLGDDAPLAHPLRQERLPDGAVDLVRAGVREVFALE